MTNDTRNTKEAEIEAIDLGDTGFHIHDALDAVVIGPYRPVSIHIA